LNSFAYFIRRFLKWFFIAFGVFAFSLFLLSFTDVPFCAYYWLGTSQPELKSKPDAIVVLGGSGMPSPDGLIRSYYAAVAAQQYKEAIIIIALPYNENDSLKQLQMMAHELMLKGVDSSRIKYEPLGFNTRSQAVHIASMLENKKKSLALLLITSPEHVYRSIRTFKKAGFANVGGVAAFERPVDAEMAKDKEHTNDKRVKSLALRYNMWSYLSYELLVLREYSAICYDKLKGWI